MIAEDLREGREIEIIDKWARPGEPPIFGTVDHVYTNTVTVNIQGELRLYFLDEVKEIAS